MRIHLTPFTKSLISKNYLKWVNDKKITKYTSLNKKISKDELKNYVIDCKNNHKINLFKIFYMKKHVGNLRISKLFKSNATIGILIGEKKYHNKGIGFISIKKATNISKKIGYENIYIFLNKKNISSLKIFLKNGYKIQKNIPQKIKLKKSDYLLKKRLL